VRTLGDVDDACLLKRFPDEEAVFIGRSDVSNAAYGFDQCTLKFWNRPLVVTDQVKAIGNGVWIERYAVARSFCWAKFAVVCVGGLVQIDMNIDALAVRRNACHRQR